MFLQRRFLTSKLLHNTLPSFEVPNSIGGVLHVSIPPGQRLIVQKGSVLSMPVKIVRCAETLRLIPPRPSWAITYEHMEAWHFECLHNTDTLPRTAVLCPKTLGTTTILKTNGISEFYLARDSFLACTTSLTVSPKAQGLGAGINGYFNYLVKGKGVIALSSGSGLQTFNLEPSESVLVNPKKLMAWESCLNPLPDQTNKYIPPKIFLESANDAPALSYIKRFGLLVHSIVRNSYNFAKYSFWGVPSEYYSIKGPGTYIMATQIHPRRLE